MHVGAGRKAGRADEADDLTLPNPAADIEAARESRHVAVGGLVAVGVTDADIFAVAALQSDLVDGAVAGGEDRRAEGRRPIDAGMYLHIVKQRVITFAEPGPHNADGDRFAHQELLRALSRLIIIIIRAVVGCLIAVVLLGLAADRQRNVAHLVPAIAGFVVRIEHVERIPRLHPALEVDIVRIDADHLLDHGVGNVIA